MANVFWPRCFRPMVVSVNVSARNTAGPQALSGYQQVIGSPAGVWSIQYDGVPLNSPARIKLWRAIQGQVEGRLTPLVVPAYDNTSLRPIVSFDAPSLGVTHTDTSTHSDASPYDQGVNDVVLSAAIARRATSTNVTKVLAGTIDAGMHFSIGHRLYRVKSIVSQTSTDAEFTFWPPARESAPSGSVLDFDRPVCKVRLATDNEMDHALTLSRFGSGGMAFIEDPN